MKLANAGQSRQRVAGKDIRPGLREGVFQMQLADPSPQIFELKRIQIGLQQFPGIDAVQNAPGDELENDQSSQLTTSTGNPSSESGIVTRRSTAWR